MIPPVPEYAAILASPIFAPDRNPASSGEASENGCGSLAGYAAIGTVAGRDVATAVITIPGGGIKTLSRGDEVEGWRLVGVDRTSAVFERNGVRHALIVGAPAEATAASSATDASGASTPATNP